MPVDDPRGGDDPRPQLAALWLPVKRKGPGFALLIAVPAACAGAVSVTEVSNGSRPAFSFYRHWISQQGIRAGRPPPVIRRAARYKYI